MHPCPWSYWGLAGVHPSKRLEVCSLGMPRSSRVLILLCCRCLHHTKDLSVSRHLMKLFLPGELIQQSHAHSFPQEPRTFNKTHVFIKQGLEFRSLLEKASVAITPDSNNWFWTNEYLSTVQYCPRNPLRLMVGRLFWEMSRHVRIMMPPWSTISILKWINILKIELDWPGIVDKDYVRLQVYTQFRPKVAQTFSSI